MTQSPGGIWRVGAMTWMGKINRNKSPLVWTFCNLNGLLGLWLRHSEPFSWEDVLTNLLWGKVRSDPGLARDEHSALIFSTRMVDLALWASYLFIVNLHSPQSPCLWLTETEFPRRAGRASVSFIAISLAHSTCLASGGSHCVVNDSLLHAAKFFLGLTWKCNQTLCL